MSIRSIIVETLEDLIDVDFETANEVATSLIDQLDLEDDSDYSLLGE